MRRFAFAVGLACASFLLPITGSAQQRASIVGVVQDATGASMPGV